MALSLHCRTCIISCSILYAMVMLTTYLAFAYAFPSALAYSYATIETQIKYHLHSAAFSDSSRQYQPLCFLKFYSPW